MFTYTAADEIDRRATNKALKSNLKAQGLPFKQFTDEWKRLRQSAPNTPEGKRLSATGVSHEMLVAEAERTAQPPADWAPKATLPVDEMIADGVIVAPVQDRLEGLDVSWTEDDILVLNTPAEPARLVFAGPLGNDTYAEVTVTHKGVTTHYELLDVEQVRAFGRQLATIDGDYTVDFEIGKPVKGRKGRTLRQQAFQHMLEQHAAGNRSLTYAQACAKFGTTPARKK